MTPSHPPLDPWDQPKTETSNPVFHRRPPAPSTVRDDWEDDDDDDDDDEINSATTHEHLDNSSSARQQSASPIMNIEENRRIWEAANAKVAAPMPTVLTSRTSSSAAPLPPAAAFQPTLRILKRPQSSTSSPRGSSVTSPAPNESLQEREARYAAARERIFRGSDNGQGDNIPDTHQGRRKDDDRKTTTPSPRPSGSTLDIIPRSEQPTQGKQDRVNLG